IKIQLVISSIRIIPPRIAIDSACTGGNSDDLKLTRGLVCQYTGRMKTVHYKRAVESHRNDFIKIRSHPANCVSRIVDLFEREILRHTTRHDGATQQTMRGETFVQPEHVLTQSHRVRVGDSESGVRTNGS